MHAMTMSRGSNSILVDRSRIYIGEHHLKERRLSDDLRHIGVSR
jgi:hypothetical protein